MKWLALKLIRGYQVTISQITPSSCKFAPSCSHYAAEAIGKHGLIKGSILTIYRLIRCNPWARGGYDPVP